MIELNRLDAFMVAETLADNGYEVTVTVKGNKATITYSRPQIKVEWVEQELD